MPDCGIWQASRWLVESAYVAHAKRSMQAHLAMITVSWPWLSSLDRALCSWTPNVAVHESDHGIC